MSQSDVEPVSVVSQAIAPIMTSTPMTVKTL